MKMCYKKILCLAASLMLSIPLCAETTIRICGFGGADKKVVEEIISKFINPKLPGMKIVYEPLEGEYLKVLMNSLSAGTAADLFYMDTFWAKNVISNGVVEPLDPYLEKSNVIKKSDIIPTLLEPFSYEGKVYGIPKDFNTLAIFYNKEIFDEGKVPYPDNNDDWNTFEEKLRRLSKNVPDVVPIAISTEFARMGAFAFAAGFEPIVNNKTNLKDKAFVTSFDWYTGLVLDKIGITPQDLSEGWGGGAFANEKTAVCIEGAWILNFLKDKAPNLDFGTCLLPKCPQTGTRGNFIYSVSWSINARSKVKNEAFKVLEILTSIEVQKWVLEKGLALPSRSSLRNDDYFKKKNKESEANLTILNGTTDGNVKAYYFGKYGGEWMGPVNTALSEVTDGETDSATAIDKAQQELNNIMKEK